MAYLQEGKMMTELVIVVKWDGLMGRASCIGLSEAVGVVAPEVSMKSSADAVRKLVEQLARFPANHGRPFVVTGDAALRGVVPAPKKAKPLGKSSVLI
jgi:hypothetical protein